MICFRDRTWCASPNCKNECGAKMSQEMKEKAKNSNEPIAWAYFCGDGDVTWEDIEKAMEDE